MFSQGNLWKRVSQNFIAKYSVRIVCAMVAN